VRIFDRQVSVDAQHYQNADDRALTHVAEREEELTEVLAEDPSLEADGAEKERYGAKIEEISKGQVEQVEVGDAELLFEDV